MKRPMLCWVSLFILGEVLSRGLPISIIGIIVAGSGIGIYKIPIRFLQKEKRLFAIGIVFFLIGVADMSYAEYKLGYCRAQVGKPVSFTGTVVETEDTDSGDTYIVKTTSIQEKKIKVLIRIRTEQQETLFESGDWIAGIGYGSPFLQATNPGGYDERKERIGNGVFLYVKGVTVEEAERRKISFPRLLTKSREYFSGIYDSLFDEREASLAKAMVLGEKATLDTDVKALYQRNGIAHLIAISGLHIAMIGGVLYRFLRKCSGSYPVSAGTGILFILAYGIMTGLSGSTLRAIIMLILSVTADVYGRKYDSITAIAVALLLMLFYNPYQITQVGFLLSFGAVIGIAVVNPLWKQIFEKLPGWLEGLMISISVQLTLLPVLLYYFYEVPVYGVILNVIVVPLMSALLFFLLACGLIGGVLWKGALPFAKVAEGIFYLYEKLCVMSERLPFHTVCTGRPQLCWIVGYYSMLTLLVLGIYNRKKIVSALSMLGFLLLFCIVWIPGPLRICIFDVGQGDGIYIRTPNGVNLLVDGGSTTKQKVGTYVLKNGMKYYGGATIDYIFLTHSDKDHYSGIAELLEDDSVVVRNIVFPDIEHPDEEYRELERQARSKGCRLYYMHKGDRIEVDGVRFACLNPERRVYADKNQGSMVLTVTKGEFDLLLTGDMDATVEAEIQDEITAQIEVLKVPHHGSKSASSEHFLEQVKPAVACISVGEKNRYGHPADEVMSRLEQNCEKIYLTKDCGAITIETDGEKYSITPFLKKE